LLVKTHILLHQKALIYFCFGIFADDRNNIERLTLAVLSYLPIAVLYVHDLSEDCGTSVADQVHVLLVLGDTRNTRDCFGSKGIGRGLRILALSNLSNSLDPKHALEENPSSCVLMCQITSFTPEILEESPSPCVQMCQITCFTSLSPKGLHLTWWVFWQYITYKHIKDRFGDRLWLDVISKCDLLGKKEPISFHDADEDVARYRRLGPEGALQVSVQTEIGVKQVSYSRASLILSSDCLLSLLIAYHSDLQALKNLG
jgi:hypothetical protein